MTYLLATPSEWGKGFFVGLSFGLLTGAFLVLCALALVSAGREHD